MSGRRPRQECGRPDAYQRGRVDDAYELGFIAAWSAAKASECPAFLKDWEGGGHTKAHLTADDTPQPVGLSSDPTHAVLKHLKYRRCDDEYYLSHEGLAALKDELLAIEIKRAAYPLGREVVTPPPEMGMRMEDVSVGMKMKSLYGGPIITVTELTEKGFMYEHPPYHLGARIGQTTGGEHFGYNGYSHYILVDEQGRRGSE